MLSLTVMDLAYARPHRQKRVSDQRLAELETLLALAKMRGKLVTVPIGFGKIDPVKIGKRKRRSQNDFLNRALTDSEIRDDELTLEDDSAKLSPQYFNLVRQYLLAWSTDQTNNNLQD